MRKENPGKFAKAAPYIVAFFLPVLVMCIVFLQRGFWPIGDRCFLRTDLYHQYAPFFQELKNKLSHGGSMFYSWNIGGGTNFWALIAYYLASPLNILVVLCPQKYIIEFITFMIVNKLGLCSLTVAYYLNKRHKKTGIAAYPAAFFGTFYALSGYMAAYQWNIMWLDCLWLFPLVILGLERLVKENKGLLYSVTLGLTIFTNYYIAIMVCMGIAVYCFFLLGTEPEMRKKFGIKLLKFIGYTILAVGMAGILLIPYIDYFSMTASASSTFKYEWYSYFSVFDMLSRHLFAVDVHTGLDHWPNIYCGVMVFMGLPLYYLNKKISLREKIGYTIVLLFFFFSFSTRSMDYIWHGLHIPNSLPCRQGFIYIFILMVMCYRGFLGLKDRSYRDLTFIMIAALVFTFAAEEFQTDEDFYHMYVFYGSAVFIVIYTALAYMYRKGKAYRDVLLIVLLTVCAIENSLNTGITSVPTVSRTDYTSFDSGVHEIMADIEENDTDAFYRVEKMALRTKNDGAWLSFPSVSTFSSVANNNLTKFYKTLGLESSTNAYGSVGQTPFTNMLMGIKYSIADSEKPETTYYDLYGSNDDNVYIYQNKYALSLGFMVDSFDVLHWNNNGTTPLVNQNNLIERVAGIRSLFLDVTPPQTMNTTVKITVQESGHYYAYSTKTGPQKVKVTFTGFSKTFENLGRSYTMDLGWIEAGETVTFANPDSSSDRKIDVSMYLLQENLLEEVYQAFSKNMMTVDVMKDTHIEGHIDVKEEGTLVTTVPYEKGWTVKVDGEKVEYDSLKDAYITLVLTAGSHTIVFDYEVPLLKVGALVTAVSVIILIAIGVTVILQKKNRKPRVKKQKKQKVKKEQDMAIPAVPEETVPDDAQPDEAVSDDALPEEAAPESEAETTLSSPGPENVSEEIPVSDEVFEEPEMPDVQEDTVPENTDLPEENEAEIPAEETISSPSLEDILFRDIEPEEKSAALQAIEHVIPAEALLFESSEAVSEKETVIRLTFPEE